MHTVAIAPGGDTSQGHTSVATSLQGTPPQIGQLRFVNVQITYYDTSDDNHTQWEEREGEESLVVIHHHN